MKANKLLFLIYISVSEIVAKKMKNWLKMIIMNVWKTLVI